MMTYRIKVRSLYVKDRDEYIIRHTELMYTMKRHEVSRSESIHVRWMRLEGRSRRVYGSWKILTQYPDQGHAHVARYVDKVDKS